MVEFSSSIPLEKSSFGINFGFTIFPNIYWASCITISLLGISKIINDNIFNIKLFKFNIDVNMIEIIVLKNAIPKIYNCALTLLLFFLVDAQFNSLYNSFIPLSIK